MFGRAYFGLRFDIISLWYSQPEIHRHQFDAVARSFYHPPKIVDLDVVALGKINLGLLCRYAEFQLLHHLAVFGPENVLLILVAHRRNPISCKPDPLDLKAAVRKLRIPAATRAQAAAVYSGRCDASSPVKNCARPNPNDQSSSVF
jgi:hypothetical protein